MILVMAAVVSAGVTILATSGIPLQAIMLSSVCIQTIQRLQPCKGSRSLFLLSGLKLFTLHVVCVCVGIIEGSHLYRVNNNIHGFGKRPPDLKGHRVNHHSNARKRKRMSWGGMYQGTSCSTQI